MSIENIFEIDESEKEWMNRRFIVRPKGAEDDWRDLLIEVSGTGTSASGAVYERSRSWRKNPINLSKGLDKDFRSDCLKFERDFFSKDDFLSGYQKWDGCCEIEISDHWCSSDGLGTRIGFAVDALMYFVQRELYINRLDDYSGDEEATLLSLQCGDGPSPKPDLEYVLVKEWSPEIRIKDPIEFTIPIVENTVENRQVYFGGSIPIWVLNQDDEQLLEVAKDNRIPIDPEEIKRAIATWQGLYKENKDD